jgi:hypothetical protein
VAFNTDYGAVELRAARLPGVVPPLPPSATNPPVLLLGVTGGADIEMVPADMTKGPVANVVDFTIRNLDPGAY